MVLEIMNYPWQWASHHTFVLVWSLDNENIALGAVLFSRLGPSKINWIKLGTLSASLESEVVYK